MELIAHLKQQRKWSKRTFGPGDRRKCIIDHIRKELDEIEQSNGDLFEWIDVVILAFDGAWRSGASPLKISGALMTKQLINEKRQWPDWRTINPEKAIEHIR